MIFDSKICKEYANSFLNAVRNEIAHKTDPQIITQILTNLKLDTLETKDEHLLNFLKNASTTSIDMTAFIDKVQSQLVDNEATCTLLGFIYFMQLISTHEIKKAAEILKLQINLLCVLEALTITLLNSDIFAMDIYKHFLKRRNLYFPGNPFVNFFFATPKAATLFERLKLISIEPAMLNFIFHRTMGTSEETIQDIDRFIDAHGLSSINANNISIAKLDNKSLGTIPNMAINVIEAMYEDATGRSKNQGGVKNAIAALGLIQIMEDRKYPSIRYQSNSTILPEGITINDDSTYPLLPGLVISNREKILNAFIVDKKWRDLYNSWNLRFVVANLDGLFLPLKLIIPSVFSQKSDLFKDARVLALYMVGNMFLTEDILHNPFFNLKFNFQNADLILQEWGNFNLEYSKYLLNNLCANTSFYPELEEEYDYIVGANPTRALFVNLISFISNSNDFRIGKMQNSIPDVCRTNNDITSIEIELENLYRRANEILKCSWRRNPQLSPEATTKEGEEFFSIMQDVVSMENKINELKKENTNKRKTSIATLSSYWNTTTKTVSSGVNYAIHRFFNRPTDEDMDDMDITFGKQRNESMDNDPDDFIMMRRTKNLF